ncbi:hypothetical protein FTX61_21565 [Nitriliruptoraceae bacterium ZYF776]|nr:hypothetical protein [Profundirhabdus halotolerans]
MRGALAAVIMIAVAACTGESEPEPLSLDRDDAGQVEDPAEPTSPPDDDQGPGDDWLPPEDVQALYASLPPLEPDPDSPVDEVTQREVLAAHERYHHVVQAAYATAEIDESLAREIMGEDLAASVLAEVDRYVSEGIVNRAGAIEIPWVRVVSGDSEEVVLQSCNLIPPEAGAFDAVSGERRDESVREEIVPLVYETTWLALEPDSALSEGSGDWQVVSSDVTPDAAGCGDEDV